MNTAKSTTEIQMIAHAVTQQQAEVCEAKRANIEDKLAALAVTVGANATSIASLAQTVTTLNTSVAILKGRPAIWAAVGSAVPVGVALLVWWLSR